jgi:YD repeat-containing protein
MGRATTFAYTTNSDGTNRTAITDPDGNTTWQDYQNNELVRLTEASLPSQPTWTFTYDPITLGLASVTDPNGHTSSNTWDNNGNLLSHTDALGRITTYTYDSMNDVLTVTDPRGNIQGATASNYTTTFRAWEGSGMAKPAVKTVDDLPPDWEASRLATQLRAHLPTLQDRYDIESAALFGSYIRNQQRPGSDLDLLVTFSQSPSLFDLVGLRDELSDLLGVPVDVVMRSSLPHRIARWVDREAVAI